MPEVKLTKLYKVNIVESEAGWGQKVDEVKYFETEQEAKNYCKEFNADNNLPSTPSWYMYAEYVGLVS